MLFGRWCNLQTVISSVHPPAPRTIVDLRVVRFDQCARQPARASALFPPSIVAAALALDAPESVRQLAVLDVPPTAVCWERADAQFTLRCWPWSLLAQDEPLPEQLLMHTGDAIVNSALSGWGTPAHVFPEAGRQIYRDSLKDPTHAHAICEACGTKAHRVCSACSPRRAIQARAPVRGLHGFATPKESARHRRDRAIALFAANGKKRRGQPCPHPSTPLSAERPRQRPSPAPPHTARTASRTAHAPT